MHISNFCLFLENRKQKVPRTGQSDIGTEIRSDRSASPDNSSTSGYSSPSAAGAQVKPFSKYCLPSLSSLLAFTVLAIRGLENKGNHTVFSLTWVKIVVLGVCRK